MSTSIEPWVVSEMKTLHLPDERLEQRTIKIISDLSRQPTASIPEFCGGRAATQAVYNYCDHDGVSDTDIIEAHRQATLQRIKAGGYGCILSVQDTTEYNFNHHPATVGLGPLDNPTVKGFFVHSSLAVTPDGLPLGLLAQQVWVRADPAEPLAKDRLIEHKESYKWLRALAESSRDIAPTVRLIQVSDQESDIYEYFVQPRSAHIDLLVRAYHPRELADTTQDMRATLATSSVRGKIEVEVRQTPDRLGRTAICQVYTQRVKLRPPRPRPGLPPTLPPVVLKAILIREMTPPAGVEPLEWLLLTTLEVSSFELACQIIQYYTFRWLIERFHFVLKSGCALEERQLRSVDRLRRFLALAQVVAWRLLWLTYLGRGRPDLLCTVAFEDYEWKALYAFIYRTTLLPAEPPTLQQATLWLAQLGGFLARKADGYPGVKVLWRGWRRLIDIAQTWLIFNPT